MEDRGDHRTRNDAESDAREDLDRTRLSESEKNRTSGEMIRVVCAGGDWVMYLRSTITLSIGSVSSQLCST